ncbi:hypothetical protein HDU76_010085, partial [Blyttiomyces sp. JEL0837]
MSSNQQQQQQQQHKQTLPKNWPSDIRYIKSLEWSSEVPTSTRLVFQTSTPATQSSIDEHVQDQNATPPQQPPPAPPPPKVPTIAIPPHSLKSPNPNVSIERITNPNHPACNQRGLFATRILHEKQHVIDYIGVIYPSDSKDIEESDYALTLDGDWKLAVDAAKGGNEARMINDFRGVPAMPEYFSLSSKSYQEKVAFVKNGNAVVEG